jgi:outer membrane protein assembly factor BamB
LCGEKVLIAHGSGHVVVVDAQTGKAGAKVDAGGAFLVGAAYYPANDLYVTAGFHGRLTAFRGSSGRLVWRYRDPDVCFAGAIFEGPIVCTMSVTGYLTAHNPLDGEVLWRVRIGGTPEGRPHSHRGRIYTFSHDEGARSLSVHAIYPFTGRMAWQLRIDGWVAGTPVFVGDRLLLPVERYGRVSIHSIPLEDLRPETEWTLELTSAGLDKPTPVRPFVLDGETHGIVRTDRSDMLAFRMRDGEVRWRVQTDPQTTLLYRNVDVAIVRDAVVSVGESVQLRSLATGALLHRFGGAMIAPEYAQAIGSLGMIIGEPGADEGFDDELVRHEIGHFLAVVE